MREVPGRGGGALIDALLWSCSPGSLRRRFFLPRPLDPSEVAERFRRYLFHPPALLAAAGNEPVGLLTLALTGDRVAEAGLLVVDAWQRRGVGTLLTRAVIQGERWRGWTIRATVQTDNAAALGVLRAAGPTARVVERAPGELTVELSIPP